MCVRMVSCASLEVKEAQCLLVIYLSVDVCVCSPSHARWPQKSLLNHRQAVISHHVQRTPSMQSVCVCVCVPVGLHCVCVCVCAPMLSGPQGVCANQPFLHLRSV